MKVMVFIYMGEINKAIFFLKTFGSVNYFTYLYSVESGGFLCKVSSKDDSFP